MKKPIKNFICCLPVILLMILTVVITTPSAQAAALAAPQLKAPVNTASGVSVSWKAVPKAQKYRVLVKTGSSAWKKLIDTKSTSVIHKTAVSGVKYTYTVRCISPDGKRCISDFNRTGKSITYVAPPAIKAFSNTASGPKLTWSAVRGAKYYAVYLKVSGKWKALAVVSSPSYVHKAAKKGVAYSYKIRCLNASKKPVSAFGTVKSHTYNYTPVKAYSNLAFANAIYASLGKAVVRPAAPSAKLTRVSAAEILVKALRYPSRKLIKLSDSKNASMLTIVSYGYLTPDSANRIYPGRAVTTAEFNAFINDVNRYALYKGKTLLTFGDSIMYGYGNQNYGYGKLIAEKTGMKHITYSQCGATFSTAINGRKHIYDEVRAAKAAGVKPDVIMINGGTNDISLVSKGAETERFSVAHPESSNLAKGFNNTMELIRTTWSSAPVMYVRDHNMAFCSASLEKNMSDYTLKLAKSFQLKIVNLYSLAAANAEKISVRDRYTLYKAELKRSDSIHPNALGYAAFYLPRISVNLDFPPELYLPVSTTDGVRLEWRPIGNVSKYRIFYHSGSSWVKLADASASGYLHRGVTPGANYTYTVRCLSADGKQFTSSYDPAGVSVTYIATPELTLANSASGLKLSWEPSAGAEKYRVLIADGDSWQTVVDVSDPYYIYTDAVPETAYTFSVRCISSDSSRYTSDPSPAQTLTYYEAPRITEVTDAPNGARLSWSAVAGAVGYRAFVKTETGWETIGDTDGLTLTHYGANHGVDYVYAVSSLDADGNPLSGLSNGYSHRFRIIGALPAPVINGAESREEGLLISWMPIIGAERYRLFVRENDRWVALGDTDGTAYLDTSAVSGVTGTYTVCCLSADGESYASVYDTAGREFTYIGVPAIRCTDTANGILLSWDKPDVAAGCRLFLKVGDSWTAFADTDDASYLYTEAVADTEYRFTACCIDAQGAPLGPHGADGTVHRYTPDPAYPARSQSAFVNDVCRILEQDVVSAAHPHMILDRQALADILCDALGYDMLTTGVELTDCSDAKLKTLVFLGYLHPDENDRIFPAAAVTDSEYDAILTEVERFHKLKGKRALAFGDSIMNGAGNNNYSSCRIMAIKYGMSFTSYAVDGASFSIVDNGRKHIPERIMLAGSKGIKADIIFLNGGTNDLSLIRKGETADVFDPANPAASPYALGFEYAMMLIRYYWGNTPVMYTRNHNMVVGTETLEQQLGEYGMGIAKKYNAHTVDIYKEAGLDTGIPAMRDRYTLYRDDLGRCDGIHPNLLGYTVYYLPLESAMLASILIP